jgi:hypothetical protein
MEIRMIEKIPVDRGAWRRAGLLAAVSDAIKPVFHIMGIGDFSHFAIADHINAGVNLHGNDLAHGFGGKPVQRCLIEILIVELRLKRLEKRLGTRQATDVGGQNSIIAVFHDEALPGNRYQGTNDL